MRCLIVDDEPLAQNILEKYVSMLEELTLVSKCSNAIQAISILQTDQIDLLLLDIQMPELNGLDMLRHLRRRPQVILTTAFSEYALTAFELEVVDYLLKPFSFERFARAIDRARQRRPDNHSLRQKMLPPPHLFLKADRKLHKVFIADILFIEGLSNYLKVYTSQGMLIIREKMSDMENALPAEQFVRVHKSFIVASSHIEYIEGNWILIRQYRVPIGESYRISFLKRINNRNL
jgi:DNA-binding LytR/AlgR family response regulator